MTLTRYLQSIHTHRSRIMGLAILSILLFHTSMRFAVGSLPEFLLETSYGGVDYFFFLSGVGIYCSLNRNSDCLAFYKKRIWRLAPAYLPILLLWFVPIFLHIQTVPEALAAVRCLLSNIFMTGWINGLDHQYNWYIQALVWFYLFSPLFFIIVQRIGNSMRKCALFFLALCLLQCTFFYQPTLIAVSRIPLYILGMLLMYRSTLEPAPTLRPFALYLVMLAGLAALYASVRFSQLGCEAYGLFWYPFALIVPGACLLLTKLFDLLEKAKPTTLLLRALGVCGESSLEIYLVHLLLYEKLPKIFPIAGNWQWLILLVFSALCGIAYHQCLKFLTKLWTKKRNKNAPAC